MFFVLSLVLLLRTLSGSSIFICIVHGLFFYSLLLLGVNGSSDCFEEDERLIDLALEEKLFSFLSLSVVSCSNFHSEVNFSFHLIFIK